jgi:threonine/homoserine/homoserine lactone efflux protein
MFIIASLTILVTPGPAVLYIITRSIDNGLIAGIISNIGLCIGNILQLIVITIGLSVLFLSSLSFHLVRYIGSIMLIYLGISKIITKNNHFPKKKENRELTKIFYQSIIIDIFNPKSAVFFIIFLPQFIIAPSMDISNQMLLLGSLYIIISIIIGCFYAILGHMIGRGLKSKYNFIHNQKYVIGSLFILIGLITIVTGYN